MFYNVIFRFQLRNSYIIALENRSNSIHQNNYYEGTLYIK